MPRSHLQRAPKVRLANRHNFALPRHCRGCGADNHIKFDRKRNLLCPVLISFAQDKVLLPCAYPFCSARSDHITAACHALHRRCLVCSLRGHAAAECRRYSAEELKDIFELHAPLGRYTRKRLMRPEWGFYPITHEEFYDLKATTRSAFPVSYEHLLALPVPAAWRKVVKFNAWVRSRLPGPLPSPPGGVEHLAVFTDV